MSFFWNGYVLRDFIFYNFNTHTIPGFIGVIIALFSVGILYEGLFYLKKDLLHKFLLTRNKSPCDRLLHRPSCSTAAPPFEPLQPSESDDNTTTSPVDPNNPRNSLLATEDLPDVVSGGGAMDPSSSSPEDEVTVGGVSGGTARRISFTQSSFYNFELPSPETIYLLLSSILHACYLFIGYTLMNAVMTFNVWVLVAVVGGIGVGYFFFRTDATGGGGGQKRRSSTQPLRNAIETDDDAEGGGGGFNERDPLQKSPRNSTRSSSSSQSKSKTDVRSNLETAPGSPEGGGSRGSRSSGGGGSRKSKNRLNADGKGGPEVVLEAESPMKSQDHQSGGNGGGGSGGGVPPAAAGAQVIVVGAQVHNNYQQSV